MPISTELSRTELSGNAQAALADRLAALETENEQLRTALASRIVIEQAKGAISVRLGVTPDEGFEMLRSLARSQNRNLHEFAAVVVARGGRFDS
jgi:AmiR/NasT family two-component response regulator